MSSTATSREIYVIGDETSKNREEVIVESGETHDMPSSAQYGYDSALTQFPYTIA